MIRLIVLSCALAVFASACQAEPEPPRAVSSLERAGTSMPSPESYAKQHASFDAYWYQNKAELTRYALRQARYGEVHDGEAVLIFVTEDFLPKPQVKQEHGESPDALSVLKLNAYRRFYTGIYPYTIMTSSFTPANGTATLKVSNTIQEWCGQVYSQINRRSDGLHALSHSYFQDDADQKMVLPDATLEDGIWARLRIAPADIKEGKREIVPGLDYIRMRHKALRAYPAVVTRKAEVETDLVDHTVAALEIDYPPVGRKLVIYYEPEFPYVIQAWEEIEGPFRTTAVRTHAIIDDYWNHHFVKDASYREALGLSY
jgi:hypothetical protein